MTQNTHDFELLESFHRGNSDAFKEIYQALQGQLFYFAVKLSGHEGVAADIVAEGFIKLWQKKPAFATMTSLKAWMFTLIQHAALNARAAEIRHETSHREIGSLLGTTESVDQVIIRSEALQAIYDQIAGLPKQCREVVEATFIGGKSTREIAKEMNLAEQTVINQKNRGIKMVRSALIKNGMLSVSVLYSALNILDTKLF